MLPYDEQNFGNPKTIFILSGKRKSGKDYIANLLLERFLPDEAVIIRLSGPLKERYALRTLFLSQNTSKTSEVKKAVIFCDQLAWRLKEHNLDYKKLLEASEYKEIHRQKMIMWGEDIRNTDPGYFCRHAIAQSNASSKKIWIVSDARRKTDIEFFLSHFPSITHTVRIQALEEVRMQRGWNFTKGVDDVESECGLDDYSNWNFQLHNNDTKDLLEGVNCLLQELKLN